jgi:Zn-dependent peptidase ImmA (M78 family)
MRLSIQKHVVDWAVARARADWDVVIARNAWVAADDGDVVHPTLRQLEKFANDMRVPVGFLFLPNPPQEKLPIPDFRTMVDAADRSPSPDLLDTVFLSQDRQEWFRGYALRNDLEQPSYVGAAPVGSGVNEVASQIREKLKFDVEQRAQASTWTEALSSLVRQADDTGVLVMVNGIVGNNTHRPLDPDEFRGFALSDKLAPLIFVNAADTKAAQMFTIIHELAHIWAGRSALTDSSPANVTSERIERWCDEIAAEVLVPEQDFERRLYQRESIEDAKNRLARIFKVSTLVILRRMFDVGHLARNEFWSIYNEELSKLKRITSKNKGGNFYATQNIRVSRRFARALIESTLRGETLYGEAFRLLSINSAETLHEYARKLGVG